MDSNFKDIVRANRQGLQDLKVDLKRTNETVRVFLVMHPVPAVLSAAWPQVERHHKKHLEYTQAQLKDDIATCLDDTGASTAASGSSVESHSCFRPCFSS